ncbi:MAG: ASKHA domain-containing protein [Candidatus Didemnitutus sp.]|nr:ASKHA domain-containing protein [Candidatus Didemnitutus sp.]
MPVTVSINSQVAPVAVGVSLFDAGESLGLHIPSSCRKQGKCRECLLEVVEGMELLTPPAEPERHLKGPFRLSCCTRVAADAGLVRCHTMRRATMQVEDRAINLPPHTRLDRPDPAVTRDGGRILLDGREIARATGPLLGLAIDLGTTTIVVRVVDLETGHITATNSFENPQRFGGTDVMARIQYDTDHAGHLLQRTLLGYLSRAIMQFPVDPRCIYEIVVVGNSTMRDLFLGLDVHGIGQKPYRSLTEHAFREGRTTTTAVSMPARELKLPCHPEARLYALPLIGGHVGGDAAACLLAVAPHLGDEIVAVMDIGTNTELVMGNRHKLLTASCPAGPAFEGRSISCGMPGLDGAIAKVKLDDHNPPLVSVIGGGKPEGVCGSGLIDLLGELRRTGRLNVYGRFADGSSEFTVHAESRIVFHERDINELAQAKGANVAGLLTVAKAWGLPLAQLDRFYLAGGFGRHLDIAAARRIGLIPNVPDDRIVQVGNAAIEGACLALLSVSRRRSLEALVQTIAHVELETDPDFFDRFVQGCQFHPIDEPEEAHE